MPLSPDFAESLTFATHLHGAQTRKGTEIPYVSHLLSVAGLVLEFGGTEDAGQHPILDELDRVVSELEAEVSHQASPAGER